MLPLFVYWNANWNETKFEEEKKNNTQWDSLALHCPADKARAREKIRFVPSVYL